ncbi:MAG: class I SAM-dependent methyltransferase [Crocinitomicaceae bacterium]|nr:class I SAM-dependent methyltransferase [Crocinitomicaceae bacterium]
MKMQGKEWFADWFDTTYYHTLYKNRDVSEAKQFIQRLIHHLPLEKNDRVLDLACGKGRHAVTLSECGFSVLGVDLSANSISEARRFENDSLKFAVHDMREVIPNEEFDGVFNLFTSFGYFDSIDENQRAVDSIAKMLKPKGTLVIDFMNVQQVVANLVKSENKSVDGITFNIERKFDGTHIFKHIRFNADGQDHSFTERVQALTLEDFSSMLDAANLKILDSFGDFDLNPFEETSSDRLIIIAQLK